MVGVPPIKGLIKRGIQRFGVAIRRTGTGPDLMDFIADRRVDVVLDVGANVGQFGESLRASQYRGKIVSFEPIAVEYGALVLKAVADGNWDTNNFALGAKAERATINVAGSSVYSSMLPLTSAALTFDGKSASSRTEAIEVRTLDDVFPGLSGNVLLKIDTQGYERQVLEGGRRLLPSLKGILLELPIIHLYEGTWRLHEAIEFMADAGFVPAQIRPVSFHSRDTVSLVEVDCLFRPRDTRLD